MLLMEKAGRNSKERVNLVEGHKFQVTHSALVAKRFETWPPLTDSSGNFSHVDAKGSEEGSSRSRDTHEIEWADVDDD